MSRWEGRRKVTRRRHVPRERAYTRRPHPFRVRNPWERLCTSKTSDGWRTIRKCVPYKPVRMTPRPMIARVLRAPASKAERNPSAQAISFRPDCYSPENPRGNNDVPLLGVVSHWDGTVPRFLAPLPLLTCGDTVTGRVCLCDFSSVWFGFVVYYCAMVRHRPSALYFGTSDKNISAPKSGRHETTLSKTHEAFRRRSVIIVRLACPDALFFA